MKFTIEHEREEDGRWLAEVPELPGVLAYGATADEAMAKAEVLALRVLAERLEQTRLSRNPSLSGSRLHDVLAFVQGPTGTFRSLPNWLDAQAPIGLAQDSFPPWLARCGLRIPRQRRDRSANARPYRETHRVDA